MRACAWLRSPFFIGVVLDQRDMIKSFVVFFLLLFLSFQYFLIFSDGDLKFLKRIPPLFSLPFFLTGRE
jgi:hypothetical protein